MMRRDWLAFLLLMLFVGTAAGQPVQNSPSLFVRVEREDARYVCGEQVTFILSARWDARMPGVPQEKDGAAVEHPLTVQLVVDGMKMQTIEVGAEPVMVPGGTRESAGFLHCTAIGRYWNEQRIYRKAVAAAAFEPEKIEPVVAMPEDFEAFWQKGREELARIPADVQLRAEPELSSDDCEVFEISFANLWGTRSYGYFSRPRNRQGPFPAYVTVAPAGAGKPYEKNVKQGMFPGMSRAGALSLYMGVWPYLGAKPDAEKYPNIDKVHGPGWLPPDGDARQYFYYRAVLGVDRAIDWLAARQDFDGKHMVMNGGSQGGGMGLIMTGLNRHITAAAVWIPALCDHAAILEGRPAGWPQVLKSVDPDGRQSGATMLAYFDAVNFARRISVPVVFGLGYCDTTCPPGSTYAAYNVLAVPKRLFADPAQGHGSPAGFNQFCSRWIPGQLGLGEPVEMDDAQH